MTTKAIPARVRWALFDPLDGQVIFTVDTAYAGRSSKERVALRRQIQRAPEHFRSLGRPDGKPFGLRTPRTRTTLVYT